MCSNEFITVEFSPSIKMQNTSIPAMINSSNSQISPVSLCMSKMHLRSVVLEMLTIIFLLYLL